MALRRQDLALAEIDLVERCGVSQSGHEPYSKMNGVHFYSTKEVQNNFVQEDYKFYGVFDGHCGTRAAKFASRALHLNLELFLNAVATDPPYPVVPDPPRRTHPSPATENSHPRSNDVPEHGGTDQQRSAARLQHSRDQDLLPDDDEFLNNQSFVENRANIEFAVRSAFQKTQEDFLATSGSRYRAAASRGGGGAPSAALQGVEGLAGASKDAEAGVGGGAGGAEEDSGTTATVALVYAHSTVVAHVGDSRAVMCCDELGRAVDVTEDHTPYSSTERERVEANGGFIEHRGVLRVNGELAVTRTIGNRRLNQHGVLSSEPDIAFISHRQEADARTTGSGGDSGDGSDNSDDDQSARSKASFLVLASDGLWDVVSSQEAVDMVKEVILGSTESAHDQAISAAAGRDRASELSSVDVAGSEGERGDGRDKRRVGAEGRRKRVPRGYGVYGPDQAFQVAATALTHEAYVRGSTDNIGVCVVDLRPH